jgi:hypothetical protein
MITLIRLAILKYKKVKWELALWQFLDSELTKITKNPEEIEKKLLPYLSKLIHESVEAERGQVNNNSFLKK